MHSVNDDKVIFFKMLNERIWAKVFLNHNFRTLAQSTFVQKTIVNE